MCVTTRSWVNIIISDIESRSMLQAAILGLPFIPLFMHIPCSLHEELMFLFILDPYSIPLCLSIAETTPTCMPSICSALLMTFSIFVATFFKHCYFVCLFWRESVGGFHALLGCDLHWCDIVGVCTLGPCFVFNLEHCCSPLKYYDRLVLHKFAHILVCGQVWHHVSLCVGNSNVPDLSPSSSVILSLE